MRFRAWYIRLLVLPIGFGALLFVPFLSQRPSAATEFAAYENVEPWTTVVINDLSLEEKVGQMLTARAFGDFTGPNDADYQRLVRLVEEFGIGCLVFFHGEPLGQASLINDLQSRSKVPLLISQDMEWGPGMRIRHATEFPRTMAIGATRNPEFAYAAGYATAREARALGTYQVFAPVADINSNPNNPIINIRSYGERADLVEEMVVSFVRGLQDGGTIATVKHFPGHGDTATDSHAALPVLPFDRARLDRVELRPFRSAIEAGAMSIMTGHLAFPQLEPDTRIPATLSAQVTRALLRNELDFQGLIVTDAMNMASVTRNFGAGEAAVRAVEAGADLILLSDDVYAAKNAIVAAVRSDRIDESRIDASVVRILASKERLGLHESRVVDVTEAAGSVATEYHTMLSETIARRSLTLLRNRNGMLPLSRDYDRVLTLVLSDEKKPGVAHAFTDRVKSLVSPGLQTVRVLDRLSPAAEYDAAIDLIDQHDLVLIPAIVNVRAWAGVIDLPRNQRRLVNAVVSSGAPTVVVSLGNPYIVRGLTEQPDVYLAAYGPSDASQKTAADALFGLSAIDGKLPVTIPGMYPYGDGLEVPQSRVRVGFPEEAGQRSDTLDTIDAVVNAAINDRAFPGAAVAIGRPGVVTKLRGYGHYTFGGDQRVTETSQFDLASLTKVVVTTTSAMQLYETGLLDLDASVADYLPAFAQNGKESVTIRHLLTHSAGLIPYRKFHDDPANDRDTIVASIMSESLVYEPGSEVRYSDLGMITLGLVVESISGMDLARYAEANIFEPLAMTSTGYRPISSGRDVLVVPTEFDVTFRGRMVQGEVHDETAFLMGGVAGHAGLFSTASDLAKFADMLLNEGKANGEQFLQPETVKLFTRRPIETGIKTERALGWDLRSRDGYSSAGRHFGPNSFGHTGFTGTSIWIDPDAQIYVILLTNRVHPTRENRKHIAVRPKVADLAYLSIAGPPEPLLPRSRY